MQIESITNFFLKWRLTRRFHRQHKRRQTDHFQTDFHDRKQDDKWTNHHLNSRLDITDPPQAFKSPTPPSTNELKMVKVGNYSPPSTPLLPRSPLSTFQFRP